MKTILKIMGLVVTKTSSGFHWMGKVYVRSFQFDRFLTEWSIAWRRLRAMVFMARLVGVREASSRRSVGWDPVLKTALFSALHPNQLNNNNNNNIYLYHKKNKW